MFITSAKPTLPGEPFGLANGFGAVKIGKVYVARHGFQFQGAYIPNGSTASVYSRSPSHTVIELNLPEKDLMN